MAGLRSACVCVWLMGLWPAGLAAAQAPSPTRSDEGRAVQLDVELDPLAFVLQGYSVHVGVRAAEVRVDLGAFSATYPTALKANPQLDASQHGAGVKVDWRMLQQRVRAAHWAQELLRGPFVGVSASYSWLTVGSATTARSESLLVLRMAVRAGWEIPIAAGFYVAPWASVGYTPAARSLRVGAERWQMDRVSLFATLHLGFRAW